MRVTMHAHTRVSVESIAQQLTPRIAQYVPEHVGPT